MSLYTPAWSLDPKTKQVIRAGYLFIDLVPHPLPRPCVLSFRFFPPSIPRWNIAARVHALFAARMFCHMRARSSWFCVASRLQTGMKIYPIRVPRLTSVCQTTPRSPFSRFLRRVAQVADNRCRTRAHVQSFFCNWRWETESTRRHVVFRMDDLRTCERSYSMLAARRKRSKLIKSLNRAGGFSETRIIFNPNRIK